MSILWVVEDGREYLEFAELFLADRFTPQGVRTYGELRDRIAAGERPDALLMDLRFDRVEPTDLVGDVEETAERLFNGDRARATKYLSEQQGLFLLAKLREAGVGVPAVFVHPFAPRQLQNLRRLYGEVDAVESFDAKVIADKLAGSGG